MQTGESLTRSDDKCKQTTKRYKLSFNFVVTQHLYLKAAGLFHQNLSFRKNYHHSFSLVSLIMIP